ncbi:hypothetical protein Tco_0149108 [Tanacetum coccineum]
MELVVEEEVAQLDHDTEWNFHSRFISVKPRLIECIPHSHINDVNSCCRHVWKAQNGIVKDVFASTNLKAIYSCVVSQICHLDCRCCGAGAGAEAWFLLVFKSYASDIIPLVLQHRMKQLGGSSEMGILSERFDNKLAGPSGGEVRGVTRL